MSMEIVVVDKDDTLTYSKRTFWPCERGKKIFTGASDFLQRQRARTRKCVVASNAVNLYRKHLAALEGLFDGFYGRELIEGIFRYRLADGTTAYIPEDYVTEHGDPIDHAKQLKLKWLPPSEWERMIHKHTGERFQYKDRYRIHTILILLSQKIFFYCVSCSRKPKRRAPS